jgi:hypothetical protein
MRQQYQVRNITRVPRPERGPDARTMIQKRGHYVSYRNHQDKVIMLRPDEVKIVNEPNEDIFSLVSQGYLSCTPLKDITEALKGHTGSARRKKLSPEAAVEADLAKATAMAQERNQGKASMMGETQDARGVTELEGAVNPDGANNFTVVAKKDSVPKRQARQR